MRFIEMTGRRFGRLVVLSYAGASQWNCVCDCGVMHRVDGYHLRSGAISSCGCLGRERLAASNQRRKEEAVPLEERFWEKVKKLPGADACWIWTAKCNNGGYGQIRAGGCNGKTLSAHRLSYHLHYGEIIPEKLLVCHHCDNPPCVRPDHLFLGTASDNTSDAVSKGRMAIGQANPRATITDANAIRLLTDYRDAPMSSGRKKKRAGIVARLANKYGVSKSVVHNITQGKTFTHITAEASREEHADAEVGVTTFE